MPDTEILDVVETQQADETQHDEPQTSLPEHASGEKPDRQGLIDEALSEGTQEAEVQQVIDDLGDVEKHPTLTLEDLKKIPGADELTDDQLVAQWNEAVKTARGETAAGTQQAAGQETVKLPFPVYDKQGNKVDYDKVKLEDLLNGELQIGYNALGKEQRKALTEVIRNASLGHFNEQKYNTALDERNRVSQQVQTLQQQVDQFNNERKVWDAALTALAMGNIEPMKKLASDYQAALTKTPLASPGMVSVDQVRAEQEQIAQGQRFINETIIPAGMDIAKRYGADPKEVIGAIEFYIRRDLNFLTREKIDQIIQFEVPQLLESKGYSVDDAGGLIDTHQAPDRVAQLETQVKAMQERIAAGANAATQAVRDKQKKAPPQGGGATPGAGDSMPSFKSRSQMKAWMQGDPEWQKA